MLLAALPFSAATLLLCGAHRADASAGRYFEGTNASCVTVLENTPVELVRARLTLNVPCYGACAFGENAPSVREEYTLFNPTQEAVNVKLAFPYELVGRDEGAESWNAQNNCTLRVGGEDVSYSVHYTYRSNDGFDAVEYVEHLENRNDAFYSSDLKVTKYVYRIALAEGEEENYIKLYLKGDAKSKIVRDERNCVSAFVENGYRCLGFRVNESDGTVTYYSIGGENEAAAVAYGRKERGTSATEETLSFELVSKTAQTFGEFVEASRNPVLTKEDWYYAAIDYFNDNEQSGMLPPLSYCQSAPFVRWYVYTLEVPAGGTAEHSVTAPLYPASSPEANCFYLQLTPLARFSNGSAAEIEITVNTPYLIDYSTMEFAKDGDAYAFSRETLPFGDLAFSLAQKPKAQPFVADRRKYDPLIVAIVILAVLVAGSIVVVAVLATKTRRDREKSAKMQRRAEMGRPEEGKIDTGKEDEQK